MESTLYVFLPDGVFPPCDHGLGFDNYLFDNSGNQSTEDDPKHFVSSCFEQKSTNNICNIKTFIISSHYY